MSGGDSCDQTLPQLFGPHFRFSKHVKAVAWFCSPTILIIWHGNGILFDMYIFVFTDPKEWQWLIFHHGYDWICFRILFLCSHSFCNGHVPFSDYSQYIEPTWCFGEMGAPWHQFFSNDLVSGGRHWQQLDTLPERCLDEKNTWANRQCWCKGFCHHLVEHLIMCKWRQMILFESQLLDSRCY